MSSKLNACEYILQKYNEEYRAKGFNGDSINKFETWKNELRELLKDILGINRMKPSDLSPIVIDSIYMEGYRRDKVLINTQKNLSMPIYVLIPDNSNGIPVIALHGHGSDGKNGLVGIYPDCCEEKIKKYNYTYALEMVKRGYVVFCPDLIGSGERRENNEKRGNDPLKTSCADLNNALISLGMSLQGLIIYDLIRLLDFIETYDECRSKKTICMGFSGGAYTTWWLSALDDRVSMAVGSGFFHGFKDTILYNNRCGCNFVPDLWRYIDIGDLTAMSAPKPIFIEIGSDDDLNGRSRLNNVYPQLDIVNCTYGMFGRKIDVNICEGKHKWYGSCYDWIEENVSEW